VAKDDRENDAADQQGLDYDQWAHPQSQRMQREAPDIGDRADDP
jgi:hypothetical protein